MLPTSPQGVPGVAGAGRAGVLEIPPAAGLTAAAMHPGATRVAIHTQPLLSCVTSVHFLDLSVL